MLHITLTNWACAGDEVEPMLRPATDVGARDSRRAARRFIASLAAGVELEPDLRYATDAEAQVLQQSAEPFMAALVAGDSTSALKHCDKEAFCDAVRQCVASSRLLEDELSENEIEVVWTEWTHVCAKTVSAHADELGSHEGYRFGTSHIHSNDASALLYVQMMFEDGREWYGIHFVDRSSRWHVADLTHVDSGQRISRGLVEVCFEQEALGQQFDDSASELDRARDLMDEGDLEAASKLLIEVCSGKLTVGIETWCLLYQSIVAARQGDHDEAMRHLADCRKAGLAIETSYRIESLVSRICGRYWWATTAEQHFLDRVGEDADVWWTIGQAYVELQQPGLAASAFNRALDVNANQLDAFAELAELPADVVGESLVERFRGLAHPEEEFSWVANKLYHRDRADELLAIVAVHREINVDDVRNDWYEANARFMNEELESGKRAMIAAIPRLEDLDMRRLGIARYFDASNDAGETATMVYDQLIASRQVDASLVFQALASVLSNREKRDELLELVGLHQQLVPNDAWSYLYQGQLEARLGRNDEAVAIYQTGYDLAEEDEIRDAIRSRIVGVYYNTGQLRRAYKELGVVPKTFVELVVRLAEDRELDDLEWLIETHRQAAPTDHRLFWADSRLAWEQMNYHRVVDLFEQHDGPIGDNYPTDRWQFDQWLFRSLIRLRRYDAAMDLADKLEPDCAETHLSQYHVTVHACQGGAAKAIELMEQMIADETTTPWWLHYDTDLGMALEGDEYEAFRSEYPREWVIDD